jgi:hypothetical protein
MRLNVIATALIGTLRRGRFPHLRNEQGLRSASDKASAAVRIHWSDANNFRPIEKAKPPRSLC